MSDMHSVSELLQELGKGDSQAARRVWDRYIQRLVGQADTALVRAPAFASLQVAMHGAAGGDGRRGSGRRAWGSGVITYWERAVRTSFQSCLGGRKRCMDRWRLIIWRLAASPGSSPSKPQ